MIRIPFSQVKIFTFIRKSFALFREIFAFISAFIRESYALFCENFTGFFRKRFAFFLLWKFRVIRQKKLSYENGFRKRRFCLILFIS